MLDNIKNLVNELEDKKEFKNYKKKNLRAFLCACFSIVEDINKIEWQLDFYSKKKNKITTFSFNSKINVKTEDIFKKDKSPIEELNLDKVNIDIDKAISIVDNLINERYKNEESSKIIAVLQKIKTELWNITFLTKSFNVINAKIDAINGNIIEEKFEPIFSFGQK